MTAQASESHQSAAKAIGCMVLGCAFLMMSDAFTKWLSQTYSIGQIMSLRNVFVLVPLFLVVWHKNSFRELRVHSWRAQLFRSIFHVASAALFVTSVGRLPLAGPEFCVMRARAGFRLIRATWSRSRRRRATGPWS